MSSSYEMDYQALISYLLIDYESKYSMRYSVRRDIRGITDIRDIFIRYLKISEANKIRNN